MNLSIIIPNYNGLSLLQKNLPKVIDAVKSFKEGKIELIIIDDKSKDDSVMFLKEFAKKDHGNVTVKILENKKNLGFSPTVNKAVKHATGDIVILLNSDVVPENGFYKSLLPHFTDETVFAVGCMDKSIESGKTVLRGRGVGVWKRGFLMHKLGDLKKNTTLWVSGGSGAFRKKIWETLGGFNELFAPYYWEDIDLSYRALKTGYEIYFEEKSVVIHKHEEGAIKKTQKPFRIQTIAYRNQFIFVWENATDFSIAFSHLIWLPYHFIKAVKRRDSAFVLGFFKAVVLLPQIIITSIRYSSKFKKKDWEVISWVGTE